jgi:uncharacterized membrane protein
MIDTTPLPARPERDEDGFRNRGHEVTRIEAFLDAAFAFAITLMVISIDEIPKSGPELVAALKSIPAFAASFYIIAIFWRGHADWSRRYGLDDRRSRANSLLLVFLVLVFVYPLRMVFSSFFHWISGGWFPANLQLETVFDIKLMFVVFALAFGSMGTAMYALYARAWRLRVAVGLDARELLVTRATMQHWAMLPLFSLISLACTWSIPADTRNTLVVALPGLIFFGLNLVEFLLGVRMRRQVAQLTPP